MFPTPMTPIFLAGISFTRLLPFARLTLCGRASRKSADTANLSRIGATRIDDYTIESVRKKVGKETTTSRKVISRDRKTIRLSVK